MSYSANSSSRLQWALRLCLPFRENLGLTFLFPSPLCCTSCVGRDFKVHCLQNLGYMIEWFIQMPVIFLQVLSQQDPVAPEIGRKSTINFSVPWWLSVCTIASFLAIFYSLDEEFVLNESPDKVYKFFSFSSFFLFFSPLWRWNTFFPPCSNA